MGLMLLDDHINLQGGSPLALQEKLKNQYLFESLNKKLSLKSKGESLLDESNIKEQ